MTDSALLTVSEVADRLGISTFRVYRRIQRGDLPATLSRSGKVRFLVSVADLEDYIDAGGGAVLSRPRASVADSWVSTGEAAQLTGFTMPTLRAMCYSGQLAYRRGSGSSGHFRISRSSLDRFVA